MKKNVSILGLVLLAASAVTASILPKDNKQNSLVNNGIVEETDPENFTCRYVGGSDGNCITDTGDPANNDPNSDTRGLQTGGQTGANDTLSL